MPFVYPVVVTLTLLSGCASDVQQRKDSLHAPRTMFASTRFRAQEGAEQRAPERTPRTTRKASNKQKVRKPRKRPVVWVPERLRYSN